MVKQACNTNCWVCEGYVEILFEVALPNKYASMDVDSVYVHLDFENYVPCVMKKKEKVEKAAEKNELMIKRKKLISQASVMQPNLQLLKKKLGKQATMQPLHQDRPNSHQVFYLWRMVPPSSTGIKHFFTF